MEEHIKILLVEDDEDDYLIIKDYLSDSSLKYDIVWANNYELFSVCIENLSVDLIITDYLLGSTSGIEILKEAKSKKPLVPVMLLTGKGNTAIDMEAMRLGAADYLVKGSYNSESLERSVRYALERAKNVKILKENEEYENTLKKLISTDRIARMLAHEIKNPLTNILLCVDQMKDVMAENESMQAYIEIITRNSKRINQLVTNLLDSTRFGDIKLEKRNLLNVVRDTLLLARDRIKLHAIEIKQEYTQAIIDLEIDEDKIKLALLNIIINAIEAVEEKKGVIEVRVVKEGPYVRIHISDNGPGISEEIKGRLFEPFFTSKTRGTGIGLASAQNIILGHKGKIEVKSRLEEGTEFIIMLPVPSV